MTQHSDDEEKDYKVGYKNPPKHTQFQPGHSLGNRKGRPKGARNLSTAVHEASNKTVLAHDGHRQRKMPKREIIATRLVNKAAEGDPKAVALVAQLDNTPVLPDAPQKKTLALQKSKSDEESSATYLATIKRAKNE